MLVAATGSAHLLMFSGIGIVGVCLANLVFARFMAPNRDAALVNSQRPTDPESMKALCRERGPHFYQVLSNVISVIMLIAGVVLIVTEA